MSRIKGCRIYHRIYSTPSSDVNQPSQPYSVLLKANHRQGALIFESGVVAELTSSEYSSLSQGYSKISDACACLGVLVTRPGLLAGGVDIRINESISYLVLVTDCRSVGKLTNFEVFQIRAVHFLCLRQANFEEEALGEIRKFLSSGAFYFSRNVSNDCPYDLTLNFQRQAEIFSKRFLVDNNDLTDPFRATICDDIHSLADTDLRFLWNRGLMSYFARAGIRPQEWTVSIICGYFKDSIVFCGPKQARLGIVSRLSAQHAGTRFYARGVNDEGDVANFVETEQVFIYYALINSH
ncbi:unnamed protein product [Protopolystoma xenopodis]|uniref:Phosphatidylinositol-3-phosphatase SAC1 n=1 Tax=Protopolystoma xenopodis TaxID=117903 RepID=A0A3S5FBY9_9PLAT|nr:unnamed protein product [Protopolystoma xenopodis]